MADFVVSYEKIKVNRAIALPDRLYSKDGRVFEI